MGIVYSIHNPTWLEKKQNKLGDCICDGYNKEKVIAEAINYFEVQMLDADECGLDEKEVLLYSYNEETDEEKEEFITLKIEVEDDSYDHGRFDFNHSRL